MAKKETGKKNDSKKSSSQKLLVAIVMGSQSDWETMRHADEALTQFGVPHESRVMSAHRSPALASEYGSNAEANRSRGRLAIVMARFRASYQRVSNPQGSAPAR